MPHCVSQSRGQPQAKTNIHTFCALAQVPAILAPWLDRLYEPEEISWILSHLRPDSGILDLSLSPAADPDFIQRMLQRGVLERDAHGTLCITPFYVRFEIWALFEGWKDIPSEVRSKVLELELTRYIHGQRDGLQCLRQGRLPDRHWVRPYSILHSEALALLEHIPHIYLWPCNCRLMMRGCSKPVYTCLRFDNERNLGWEISTHRAQEIAHWAHSQGLMHCAEIGLDSKGSLRGALCNCCADCCFPHALAEHEGVQGLFPLSRYQAVFTPELCSGCKKCLRLCPFQALTLRPSRTGDEPVLEYHPSRCRGCGLCAWHCPTGALNMHKRDSQGLISQEVEELFLLQNNTNKATES